jgi:hypothetical protein
MEKHLADIIAKIKVDMDNHAHDAMQMSVADLGKYGEIVGAYRGMQHCLDIIDIVLKTESDLDSTL